MKGFQYLSLVFLSFVLLCTSVYATPEHYINPPNNLNPDPDYVPGDFPLPNMTSALARYDSDEKTLMARAEASTDTIFIAETDGALMANVIKNETATVLGTFRDFNGYLAFRNGTFSEAKLVISVNSWDSGVPGRDARIRTLFFRSMSSSYATATLTLDRITEGENELAKLQDGAVHTVTTSGTIKFAGMTVNIKPRIELRWDIGIWWIVPAEPLEVTISDFGLSGSVLSLMIECNHKSIGNRVTLDWSVAFVEPEPPETK